MEGTLLLFVIFNVCVTVNSYFHRHPKINSGNFDGSDPGKPLFLTPYVESGNIDEGRRRARVLFTESLRIRSYAGYFTVNKTYNSNQFFWYFPAMMPDNKYAPVVVWLQGGPGGTSLFGLFIENGPLRVRNNKFERRKLNWALNHHLIYIDNPVGAGFSFTNDSKGYCTDETQIGVQLYSTLVQFFKLFPELQENKFFVTGESYAGKYVPALAYTIHKMNPTAKLKINMKGIAIGNGFIDPQNQLMYGKYLYQIGLIDWNQAKVFEEYENKVVNLIKRNDFEMAADTFNVLFDYNDIGQESIFTNTTGFNYNYNYLHTEDYIEDYRPMIQKSAIRRSIHVGNKTFNAGIEAAKYLKQDIMKSVAPWLSELLEHYDVLLYNGQLDILVAYPLTVNFLKNLNFTGADEYKTAKRNIWQVDGEVAGYVKRAGKLVEILVRNAGHVVPKDQPKWALDMITRFTQNKKFCGSKISNKLIF